MGVKETLGKLICLTDYGVRADADSARTSGRKRAKLYSLHHGVAGEVVWKIFIYLFKACANNVNHNIV